jgi:8-oxo-dGTP diphosphatase
MVSVIMATYKYARPATAVDTIIFTIRNNRLEILLVNRGIEPFKGCLALPGGFVRMDETLMDAAKRELTEETGLPDLHIKMFGIFDGVNRDPRDRVISVGFYAIISCIDIEVIAGSDAANADWYDFESLPALAFDHNTVIKLAYQTLTADLEHSFLAARFLANEFTLAELQSVHEIILGKTLDKRNFRKWITSTGYFVKTQNTKSGGQHRPAALYKVGDFDAVVDEAAQLTLPVEPRKSTEENEFKQGYKQGFEAALADVSKFIIDRKAG